MMDLRPSQRRRQRSFAVITPGLIESSSAASYVRRLPRGATIDHACRPGAQFGRAEPPACCLIVRTPDHGGELTILPQRPSLRKYVKG